MTSIRPVKQTLTKYRARFPQGCSVSSCDTIIEIGDYYWRNPNVKYCLEHGDLARKGQLIIEDGRYTFKDEL